MGGAKNCFSNINYWDYFELHKEEKKFLFVLRILSRTVFKIDVDQILLCPLTVTFQLCPNARYTNCGLLKT